MTRPYQQHAPKNCSTVQISAFSKSTLLEPQFWGWYGSLDTSLPVDISLWIKQVFIPFVLWLAFWSFHLKSNRNAYFNIMLT